MVNMTMFEKHLEKEILRVAANGPTQLKDAMIYAVFPGGGRVRPRLTLEIINALGYDLNHAALGGAISIELIHCASLVHDDLPCFDNSDTRRGKPSVHQEFGESTALLVGDALIVAAFDTIVKHFTHQSHIIGPMVQTLARASGASDGIIAGQASETDKKVDIQTVHTKKTGALFDAAAGIAALSVGEETEQWRKIGQQLGRAYQLADDILDAVGNAEIAGKPVSQDIRNERPNAIIEENLQMSVLQLDNTIESAIKAIPDCPGRHRLTALLVGVATRLCPPTVIPRDSNLMMKISYPALSEPLADLQAVV
jgi:geranylgeranyl diphosphate synthase, type II